MRHGERAGLVWGQGCGGCMPACAVRAAGVLVHLCPWHQCAVVIPESLPHTPSCSDYPLDLRPLWLHARRYSCGEGSWSFSAPPPEWAHPDWLPPAPYDQQWHAAAAAAACGGGGGKLFPERL